MFDLLQWIDKNFTTSNKIDPRNGVDNEKVTAEKSEDLCKADAKLREISKRTFIIENSKKMSLETMLKLILKLFVWKISVIQKSQVEALSIKVCKIFN